MNIIHQNSKMLTQQFIKSALRNPLQNQKCWELHSGSCNSTAFSQFLQGCQGVYKMYLFAHLIPLILFKRKKFAKNPFNELKKFLIGFACSLIFAGGSSGVIRRVLCILQKYSNHYIIMLISPIIAGILIIFQSKTRQTQITLFALNKSIETLYNMALRRQWRVRVPLGQCWLVAVSLAIICLTYMDDAEVWRPSYRKAMDKILKDI